jgi:hypothetical protein
MKIYVKIHEKCDRKLKSITFFMNFYIDFKPIYYSNPRNTQTTMLGFLEKDQQLLQPIETRAVKLEIFELENLKFTNF